MTTDASAKDNWRAENLNSSLMTLLLRVFGLRHIVLSAHMFLGRKMNSGVAHLWLSQTVSCLSSLPDQNISVSAWFKVSATEGWIQNRDQGGPMVIF